MMKKRMLAILLLMCMMLTGCGQEQPKQPEATAEPGQVPAATEESAGNPAKAYLIVTVAGAVYEPIPLQEPGRYTITRGDHVNVIEVTEDSVRMAESSCDNQDCIYQGTVTLENKKERVLQNMILCLPNEVILELYTYEELQQVMPDWLEAQGQ